MPLGAAWRSPRITTAAAPVGFNLSITRNLRACSLSRFCGVPDERIAASPAFVVNRPLLLPACWAPPQSL